MGNYADVVELFKASSKRADAKDSKGNAYPRFTLGQADAEKYADSRGVTKAMIKSMSEVTSELYNGGYAFAGEQLVTAIETAKKEGTDPALARVEIVISTCNGPDKMTIKAKKENNNPANADKKAIGYGSLRMNIVRKRTMDSAAMDTIQAQIKTALGE